MSEPTTPLGEAAVSMHELFIEYIRAGFTRTEALQLVVAQVQAAATEQ